MAKRTPAATQGGALGAGLFRARDTFYWKGTVLVTAGDTVEAGHPMLAGREQLFTAFSPTFPVNGPQPLPIADVPRGTDPEPEDEQPAEPDPDAE